MVSKKNFQQNGRVNQQQRQVPYKKPPFKPPMMQNFNNPMFNVSQIPDNPGYLDFNLPTPPTNNATGNNGPANNAKVGNGNNAGTAAAQAKKKNNKNKQRNKQPTQNNQNGGNWKNRNQQGGGQINQRFNGGGNNVGRNFQSMGNRRNNRMMGPMGGPRGMGFNGPQIPPPMGFQPPMMPPMGRNGPPIPPMGGPVPPPYMRRGNGPMPPPIPPMLPPRMGRGMPPVPFNGPIAGTGKVNKKGKINKKVTKGKSTIKTLKNLINQYPLDKPWVNNEIRVEHDKKIDIENRLKGNKNDELFAQFKVQRDKFVSLYEAAREGYLKKEAAAVKTKDEKDKQTNNTAKKDEKKEVKTNQSKTKTV